MQTVFLAVYFVGIAALSTFTLYKFAHDWLWTSPIIATLAGTAMMTVYLGGMPSPADERWMTLWAVFMPFQQLIAISICLGTLSGLRWGGSLGLAVGGSGVVLGLMIVAVTDMAFLLYPICLMLYGAVLILSFTGKDKKDWDELCQGNEPEKCNL